MSLAETKKQECCGKGDQAELFHLLEALVPEAVLVVHPRGGADRPARRADDAPRKEDRPRVSAVRVKAVNHPVRRSGVEVPIVPFIGSPTEHAGGEEVRRGGLPRGFTWSCG